MMFRSSLQRSCVGAPSSMVSMLGMQSRAFSTIKQRVFNDAIFMSEMYPARLSIPVPDKNGAKTVFEFTCDNDAKVGDFCRTVADSTNLDVSEFELLNTKKEAIADSMTLREVKAQKFMMRVRNQTFEVYPDLRSIVRREKPKKNVKEMEKALHMEQSITISRQMILRDFYKEMVTELKKEAATGGKLTQEKLTKGINQAIEKFAAQVKAENASAQSVLEELRSDLEKLKQTQSQMEKDSHKKAGIMLLGGFLGTVGQLVGFTVGIYGIADWNEMEPWTWIAQAFYMMVGSWFYLFTRSDWVYTSVYSSLQQSQLKKIMAQEKSEDYFDRIEAMEEYVDQVAFQLSLISGETELEQRQDDLDQQEATAK